ncbi:MAG: acyl--CoA ligase [bacterium]|nr:acyl--CoA ligase [bacterium]
MPPRQNDNLVIHQHSEYRIADLAHRYESRYPWKLQSPVALILSDELECVAAAAWLAGTGIDALLLPEERYTPALHELLLESGYVIELKHSHTEPRVATPLQPNRITLLTSGTVGMPKLIPHTWDTLFTLHRTKKRIEPNNWLVSYQPGTYAWYQLITMGLFVPEQTLTISNSRDPFDQFRVAIASNVTAVSATPTFWRYLLMRFTDHELKKLKLRQITLGGERVDQAILHQVSKLFPNARITHIYASTEVGVGIVVHDGMAGFPADWITTKEDTSQYDSDNSAPRLKIADDILWVMSKNAMSNATGWINTGDVTRRVGDRIEIIGRAGSELINVGGAKVIPGEIEQLLLSHPDVLWCRVFGRRAPLVGELVVVELVLRKGSAVRENDLIEYLNGRVASYAIPRLWSFLEEIPLTANLKTAQQHH